MSTLILDPSLFGTAMNSESTISLNDWSMNTAGWGTQGGSTMSYDHNGHTYETWRHDTTLCRAGLALLASCKIDYKRSGKDDHMVMLATFNTDLHIISAQASVQSMDANDMARTNAIYAQPAAGAYPDAATDAQVASTLQSAVYQACYSFDGQDTDDGFLDFQHVAYHNLLCMQKALALV
jgi:hypothetical protein